MLKSLVLAMLIHIEFFMRFANRRYNCSVWKLLNWGYKSLVLASLIHILWFIDHRYAGGTINQKNLGQNGDSWVASFWPKSWLHPTWGVVSPLLLKMVQFFYCWKNINLCNQIEQEIYNMIQWVIVNLKYSYITKMVQCM